MEMFSPAGGQAASEEDASSALQLKKASGPYTRKKNFCFSPASMPVECRGSPEITRGDQKLSRRTDREFLASCFTTQASTAKRAGNIPANFAADTVKASSPFLKKRTKKLLLPLASAAARCLLINQGV